MTPDGQTPDRDDRDEYREGRAERPAQGPGQRIEEAEASLPPGSDTLDEDGPRGDVDRSEPYEASAAPERMGDEQPPPGS